LDREDYLESISEKSLKLIRTSIFVLGIYIYQFFLQFLIY